MLSIDKSVKSNGDGNLTITVLQSSAPFSDGHDDASHTVRNTSIFSDPPDIYEWAQTQYRFDAGAHEAQPQRSAAELFMRPFDGLTPYLGPLAVTPLDHRFVWMICRRRIRRSYNRDLERWSVSTRGRAVKRLSEVRSECLPEEPLCSRRGIVSVTFLSAADGHPVGNRAQ